MLAYEVLTGNTSDKMTLRDFLKKIEAKYDKAERIWVMDRGHAGFRPSKAGSAAPWLELSFPHPAPEATCPKLPWSTHRQTR